MLQLSALRERTEYVIQRLSVKNLDAKPVVEKILSIDEERRKVQTELDQLLNQQNTIAKKVGELYKSGNKAEGDDLKNKSTALKQTVAELSDRLSKLEEEVNQELVKLPNMPSERVPAGRTPEDNEVVHQEGNLPSLDSTAKPHWEIAAQYDIIDFEIGRAHV